MLQNLKGKDKFKNIKGVIKDVQKGKFVIVIDEKTREDEGDLVLAAEKATPHKLNFMIRHAHGLMCLPCEGKILDRLQVPMMTKKLADKFQTPFTVSVDARKNTTSGVSVYDRMEVLRALLNPKSKKSDLMMPGHSFPLRAHQELLNKRHGHTEATIELLKLAKMEPVGVITEILKEDGSMARSPYLKKFSKKFGIKIISIPAIIVYKAHIYGSKSKTN